MRDFDETSKYERPQKLCETSATSGEENWQFSKIPTLSEIPNRKKIPDSILLSCKLLDSVYDEVRNHPNLCCSTLTTRKVRVPVQRSLVRGDQMLSWANRIQITSDVITYRLELDIKIAIILTSQELSKYQKKFYFLCHNPAQKIIQQCYGGRSQKTLGSPITNQK